MTKRRVRYSELATPVAAAISNAARNATPADAGPSAAATTAAVPVATERPRRNSTPVELARALAAARAAEEPADSPQVPPAIARRSGPRALHATMRDGARARFGIAELLIFRIAGERFAVELLAVDEVIDLPVIHHVPEMPPAMLGVVTVRGSLTPVYSPHRALGLPLALREAMLIFRRGGRRIGVLIDDVEDAVSLDLAELRDAPAGEEIDTVVLGVIRHADSLVGIVDADALIAACQTAALQEIA